MYRDMHKGFSPSRTNLASGLRRSTTIYNPFITHYIPLYTPLYTPLNSITLHRHAGSLE